MHGTARGGVAKAKGQQLLGASPGKPWGCVAGQSGSDKLKEAPFAVF